MKTEHKGYKIKQDSDTHHVAIFDKNGHMVFHAQASKEKTVEELRETVDFYLMLSETLMEKEGV